MKTDDITVGILTHNRCEMNKFCIPKIIGATKEAKIIIYDNGSTDGTRKWLQSQEFPSNIEIIYSNNNSGICAFNEIFKNNSYYITIDSDVVPPKFYDIKLKMIYQHFEQGKIPVCLLGLNMKWGFDKTFYDKFNIKHNFRIAGMDVGVIEPQEGLKKHVTIPGGCRMISDHNLHQIGGFPNMIYGADGPMAFKSYRNGFYNAFIRSEEMVHYGGYPSVKGKIIPKDDEKYRNWKLNELRKLVVDIIIPYHNLGDMTCQCLESIQRTTHVPFRVILVNNGSKLSEVEKVKDFVNKSRMRKHFIDNKENEFFLKATNQGIKVSKAKHILFLNNDVLLTDNWFDKMSRFYTDNKVGVVSCLSTGKNGYQSMAGMRKYYGLFPKIKAEELSVEEINRKLMNYGYKNVAMVAFFCALFKKNIFNKVGILDERFEAGLMEDDEFCLRLRRNGYRIVLDLRTCVVHKFRTTWNELNIDWMSIVAKNRKLYNEIRGKKK